MEPLAGKQRCPGKRSVPRLPLEPLDRREVESPLRQKDMRNSRSGDGFPQLVQNSIRVSDRRDEDVKITGAVERTPPP